MHHRIMAFNTDSLGMLTTEHAAGSNPRDEAFARHRAHTLAMLESFIRAATDEPVGTMAPGASERSVF